MSQNRVFMLRSRPVGEDYETALPFETHAIPVPRDGDVLVRNIFLSLDPANRLWVREQGSYMPPLPLDQPMMGLVLGEVVESRFDGLKPGDLVTGAGQWGDYSLIAGAEAAPVQRDPAIPLAAYSGPLHATGWTAYWGLLDVGQPREGETLLVSAAAGAVGSLVGQIGKIKGLRVVGLAGSDEKCQWLTDELGFDAAINYKTSADLSAAIAAACPDGIDIYFENVGMPIFDIVLEHVNIGARIPLCGLIAQYNATEPVCNSYKLERLLIQRVRMQGFLVLDYFDRTPEAVADLSQWIRDGKLKYNIDIVDGLENTLTAFRRLFSGSNRGKQLVRIGADP